ncbi:MAG: efflux RND transporter periplasmic adaptor subunit [Rhodospirillales bacterium]|nr:MAG: efflux RND transporter periplasmic adaptor subunit [Rhodospirillales bacterium]
MKALGLTIHSVPGGHVMERVEPPLLREDKTMRLAGKRAILLAVLLLAGVMWDPGPGRAQGKAARVAVDAVAIEPLTQTVPALGRFVARQSGPVAALVGGPVAEVLVEVGDRVAKGDVMVRLSTDSSLGQRNLREAELHEEEAALETARAQARLASLELRRLESLKKSAAFSQARYEDKLTEVARYDSEVAEAVAAVIRADANLRLAELDLERADIQAPYNGVVTVLQATEGAYVNTGAPVVTLVNDESLEIEADVSAERLSALTPGLDVSARLDDGRQFTASVRAVIPTENALTRTRPVRFTPHIDQMDGVRLATDQSVSVLLPIGEPRPVVSVHKDAVIARGTGYIVFVVIDGKATPRPVRLGEATGPRMEVLSGLMAGDLVVVRGNERLLPGQPVKYDSPEAPGGNG